MAVQIKHNRDFDIAYAQVDQLSPLVRRVICKNPGPFTFKGTATFLLGQGQQTAVIDPGPLYEPHLEALLGALGPDETISHIFITHTHSDHSPGAAWIKERTGATIYGYGPHGKVRADDPNDKVDFSGYISADEKEKYDKEYDDIPPELKREGPDLAFQPDERLEDNEAVSGAGWTMTAVHTPGHCSNHLCYSLAEEQTLFTGDHVMGWATSVVGPPDGSMGQYLDSLRKLLPRDDLRYRPTHGPAIEDPIAYVQSFIDHREDREAQILAYLQDGPKRIADIVPVMYEGYDKRLWYPAAGSVYAHMLHLVESGRIAADTDEPKLRSLYSLLGR